MSLGITGNILVFKLSDVELGITSKCQPLKWVSCVNMLCNFFNTVCMTCINVMPYLLPSHCRFNDFPLCKHIYMQCTSMLVFPLCSEYCKVMIFCQSHSGT